MGFAVSIAQLFPPVKNPVEKPGTMSVPGLRSFLLLGGKLVLPHAAELAGEIVGQVFPLHAFFFLIVNPAANIANVSHAVLSFPVIRCRALFRAAALIPLYTIALRLSTLFLCSARPGLILASPRV